MPVLASLAVPTVRKTGLSQLFTFSVYHQFMVATVQTLIVSTTEPLDYILFPKIVVCNKYKLRSVKRGIE